MNPYVFVVLLLYISSDAARIFTFPRCPSSSHHHCSFRLAMPQAVAYHNFIPFSYSEYDPAMVKAQPEVQRIV